MTQYEQWSKGLIGNFGSFHTTILQAYQIADNGNRERLEKAFPEWFVFKPGDNPLEGATINHKVLDRLVGDHLSL